MQGSSFKKRKSVRIAILSFIIAVLFLAGCTATSRQIKPAPGGAEMLYRSNCSACHRLRPPALYTYPKLKEYVDKYTRGLSVEERQNLLQYLEQNSKEAR